MSRGNNNQKPRDRITRKSQRRSLSSPRHFAPRVLFVILLRPVVFAPRWGPLSTLLSFLHLVANSLTVSLGSSYLHNPIHTRILSLLTTAIPIEQKTKNLHNSMTKLHGSLPGVMDAFHRVSTDVSDLLPPGSESHKVCVKHDDVSWDDEE